MADSLTAYLPHGDTSYVYVHLRSDTGRPFYVGKGRQQRAFTTKNRNQHWRSIARKAGYVTWIVRRGISDAVASRLERRLIAIYRSRRGEWSLANMTAGGDGVTGYRHTQETRQRQSERQRGISRPAPPQRGPAITRAKLDRPTRRSRPVLCRDTGEVFVSCGQTARAHGLDRANLLQALNGTRYHKTAKGRRYVWLIA